MTRCFFPWAVGLGLLLAVTWPRLGHSATITVTAGQSINDAIGRTQAGGTVLVEDGTYNETLNTNNLANGSSQQPTTLKAKNRGKVILQPGGSGPIASFHGKSWIVYDGFVHDGTNMSTSGGGLDLNAQTGLDNITIDSVEIRNMKGDTEGSQGNYLTTAAIGATYPATNVIMRNLYVHDIGVNQSAGNSCNECYGYGIYLSGNGYTLENSRFVHIAGFVVHGYSSGANSVSNNSIRNNYFEDTGGAVLLCQSHNEISGNILNRVGIGAAGGHRAGIILNVYCSGQPATGNTIMHNTIYQSAGPCIDLGGSSAGRVQNNICYRNASDSILNGGSGNTTSHNLLGTDPRFVNADQGDFHLQPGSPAIDAGVQVGRPFQGAAPDLGACEVGEQTCGGPGTTTPTPTVPPPTGLRLGPGPEGLR